MTLDPTLPDLSRHLTHCAAGLDDQPVTLGALAQLHGPALPGSLLVLVSAPCTLPIPGVGNVLGVTMVLMAWAMWRGQAWAVLPGRVSRLVVSARMARVLLRMLAQVYGWSGRWSRERLPHLTALERRTLLAPKLALMGVVIFLPVPFGNILPALAVVALGIGVAFRDGLAVVSAVGLAAMSVVYTAAVGLGTWTWLVEPMLAWSRSLVG